MRVFGTELPNIVKHVKSGKITYTIDLLRALRAVNDSSLQNAVNLLYDGLHKGIFEEFKSDASS